MAYIANRPCRFGEQDFFKGDIIPENLILPERVAALIRSKVITDTVSGVSDFADCVAQVGVVKFAIPIHTESGDLEVEVTEEEVVQVFDVLQATAKEAEEVINTITSENVLILLDVTDKRKGIHNLVTERANALFKPDEGQEA